LPALSYGDVYKLKVDDIVLGMDGRRWIKTRRKKTKTLSSIPLMPEAETLLKKYEDHPLIKSGKGLLPVPSNQNYNVYLKELADLSKINKTLTTHIARHTFATTVTLSNGVPIESVSKMLGHTSIKTTQIYAKVLDAKLSEDMAALQERMKFRSYSRLLKE
jgi:site-specific recombinase XerD